MNSITPPTFEWLQLAPILVVLLAACVGWHRREARPAWWEYFRFTELLTEELVADLRKPLVRP